MSFIVLEGGNFTQIQDLGRFGYHAMGVGHGGVMDRHAARWANQLLGNPANAPLLEVSYGLLRLRASKPMLVALCGADLHNQHNGKVCGTWCSVQLRANDELQFTHPQHGFRLYLAVKGGFSLTPHLGSCSTVTREGLGGLTHHGEPLKAGQRIPAQQSEGEESEVPPWARRDYPEHLRLDLILGAQQDMFSAQAKLRLFNSRYTLSDACDRMGYRLEGPALMPCCSGIVSEGVAYGAVQVPSDGQPIILLNDRQSMGGYAQLGCISPDSAYRLSQCGPQATVSFREVTMSDAEQTLHLLQRQFT